LIIRDLLKAANVQKQI